MEGYEGVSVVGLAPCRVSPMGWAPCFKDASNSWAQWSDCDKALGYITEKHFHKTEQLTWERLRMPVAP